jgi:hypothetical protein
VLIIFAIDAIYIVNPKNYIEIFHMNDMGKNEETRKIQFTGKSSYIVSLPKEWVIDMGLKQGDQVAVVRQGVSNLQIVPLKHHNKPIGTEEATIEIKPED